MSIPTAHRPPASASRVPWMPLVLLACGALALAGGLTHRRGLSLAAVLLLLFACLPAVWRRHSAVALGIWLALAALLLVPSSLGHPQLAFMALPVVFLAGFAWVFGRTLRPGREPLIARLVRVMEGDARLELPGVRGYARGVTVFWACLLGTMSLLSLAIALLATPGGWLALLGVHAPLTLPGSLVEWYPEAGCWVVLVVAFVGEYLFRRWYLRRIPHPTVKRFVTQIVQRWPQFIAGDDGAR